MFRVNQSVTTPKGKGIVQGVYHDGRYIVRLPIDEQTKKYSDHCLTPNATISGLWTFKESDLK